MNTLTSKILTHPLPQSSPRIVVLLLRRVPFSCSSVAASESLRTTVVSFSSSSFPQQQRSDYDGGGGRRNVRVSVWWDFENCGLPAGANPYRVAQFITAAVRANGIKGPVQITAFGDVLQLSRANQVALSSTGVNLTHIPGGERNNADRSLLVDLMYWVSQNPPPAHLFLISGDRDFAGVLHRLRMNNYNILLASRDGALNVLCSAASIMWRWNELAKGTNLVGRHFNQPPDGPSHSWYGQLEMPLEDPYACAVPETPGRYCGIDDSSDHEVVRPVPNAVVKTIYRMVKSHPKGIPISELRYALGKCNVQIDKYIFGYKKFSRLLLSMPEIFKLRDCNDGKIIVTAVSPETDRSLDRNSSVFKGSMGGSSSNQDGTSLRTKGDVFSLTTEADEDAEGASNVKCKTGAYGESIFLDGGKVSSSSNINCSVLDVAKVADNGEPAPSPHDVDEEDKKVKQVPGRMLGDAGLVKGQGPPVNDLSSNESGISVKKLLEEKISANMRGAFPGRWAKWLNWKKDDVNMQVPKTPDQFHDSSGCFESSDPSKKCDEPTNARGTSAPSSFSLAKAAGSKDAQSELVTQNEGSGDAKGNIVAGGHDAASKADTSSSFLAKMIIWCKSWRKISNANVSTDYSGEDLKLMSNTEKQELILTDTHFRDVESFINSYEGLSIILNSGSREDIAQALQKGGSTTLQSLSMVDLLRLVDLSITEKKWIKECPSQTYPFGVIQSHEINAAPAHSTPNSSGLSSIFLRSPSQSDSANLPEHDEERKVENRPHSVVSSVLGKKLPRRSRTQILADCRKLTGDLLEENPAGFDIQCFRRLFIERYGYVLDHEKLGYSKLGSLLQIIPGVKIKSNVVSSAKVLQNDQSEEGQGSKCILEASLKDDGNDSPWDELGPVEDPRVAKVEVKEGGRKADDGYESSVSDDDGLSDLEEEVAQTENKSNKDSLLLQILDSWYSKKGDSKGCADNINMDSTIDFSSCSSKPSVASRSGVKQGDNKNETSVSFSRRRVPAKNYTFVSDSSEEGKDRLIDGILGSLKKSGEAKVEG